MGTDDNAVSLQGRDSLRYSHSQVQPGHPAVLAGRRHGWTQILLALWGQGGAGDWAILLRRW